MAEATPPKQPPSAASAPSPPPSTSPPVTAPAPPRFLWPNFMAEEDDCYPKPGHSRLGNDFAQIWKAALGTAAPVMGDFYWEDVPELTHPAPLARPTAEPVFPELGDLSGQAIAWLNSKKFLNALEYPGIPHAGAAPAIVGRVHDKAWLARFRAAAGLEPPDFAGCTQILEPADLGNADALVARIEAAVRTWPSSLAGQFTLKPRFGCAGRGRVPGTLAQCDSPQLRGSLRRLADRGGAVLEPWLDRTGDLTTIVHVPATGPVQVLGTLTSLLSVSGSWVGHSGWIVGRSVASGTVWDAALRQAAATIGTAAQAAGFFGPAGVDAFSYRCRETGVVRLQPAVEFNARWNMAWIALGLTRRLAATLAFSPAPRRFRWHIDNLPEPLLPFAYREPLIIGDSRLARMEIEV